MRSIFVLLAVAFAASDAAQPIDVAQARLVAKHPGQADVGVKRGIVFDAERSLAFDLYEPASSPPAQGHPALILVSGTERAREWLGFQDLARLAAAHGFVAIIPDKRYPRGWEGLLSGTADTQAALKFIAQDAAELGIAPDRIAVWTFSGGGRLTAAVLQPDLPAVRCLVNYYGLLDLTDELARVSDETRRNELLERYSPSHVYGARGPAAPPFLVVRAGQDGAVINRSIDRFVAAALAGNAPLKLINSPAAVHGFDLFQDNDESRRLIAETFEFLRAQLKTGAAP